MTTAYRPTFVSHAHADNELCDRYVAGLRARGIDVWYDRTNLQVGHSLSSEIEAELRKRTGFVVIATPASLASQWVRSEIAAFRSLAAHDPTRLFVPVRAIPCEMPLLWADILWFDALALGFDAAIDALASALAQLDATISPPTSVPQPIHASPTLPVLPAHPGPAPAPAGAGLAHHLTPMSLYAIGFRGYSIGGVECVLPPICPVPGGVFIMGSDKTQYQEAEDDETPQYPVQVDDFSVGQHPVTVAEYACAVRARAVREPPKWEYAWEGDEWKTDWQKQLAHLDHPVVCVSWHDSVAYTSWLASLTHQSWRLPTEAEWEKMARWDAHAGQAGQSRIYPWGDTFDKMRCNTWESAIKTTTPVGRFPNGASPYGAHDVAGNVWEWTSSLYKPYAYNQSDGREDQNSTENRVLRGGSWYVDRRVARAACRFVGVPDSVGADVGFRVVLAAPGS